MSAIPPTPSTPDPPQVELWSPIEGWSLYEISNLGRVRRLSYRAKDGRILKERVIKQRRAKNGYVRLDLHQNGRHATPILHTLVPKHWPDGIPVPKRDLHVQKQEVLEGMKLIPLWRAAQKYDYSIRTLSLYKSNGIISNPARGYVYEHEVKQRRMTRQWRQGPKRSVAAQPKKAEPAPKKEQRYIVEQTPHGSIVRDTRKPLFP